MALRDFNLRVVASDVDGHIVDIHQTWIGDGEREVDGLAVFGDAVDVRVLIAVVLNEEERCIFCESCHGKLLRPSALSRDDETQFAKHFVGVGKLKYRIAVGIGHSESNQILAFEDADAEAFKSPVLGLDGNDGACSALEDALLVGDIRGDRLLKPRIQASVAQYIETIDVPTHASVFFAIGSHPWRSGNLGFAQGHADGGDEVVAVGIHKLAVDMGRHTVAPRHIPAVA